MVLQQRQYALLNYDFSEGSCVRYTEENKNFVYFNKFENFVFDFSRCRENGWLTGGQSDIKSNISVYFLLFKRRIHSFYSQLLNS